MMTDVSNASQSLNVNRIHFRQYGVDTVSLRHYVIWPGGFVVQEAAISCVLMVGIIKHYLPFSY